MFLQVIECDRPAYGGPVSMDDLLRPSLRVVPALWWVDSAVNLRWVTLGRIRWWQWLRKLRFRSTWKDWPVRLVHKESFNV